ncbi:MAG: hypothetical protein ABW221_04235 [Vicinamibacteria bacterium]
MRRCSVVLVLALSAAHARAHDRWEYVVFNSSDDGAATLNFLQHGSRQTHHDLEFDSVQGFDSDWYAVRTAAGHSYEVRVNGGIMMWNPTCSGLCPKLDLVDGAGGVLGTGSISSEDVSFVSGGTQIGLGTTLRWSAGTGLNLLRVGPPGLPTGPEPSYDISFRDTSYSVPRWNNSGSQVSIFVVQNTTPYQVAADIRLFDAQGTQLTVHPLTLLPRGLAVFSTASSPALAGKSGSALITHRGGYGALAGKVVAVEASTGFTFDTPIQPIPY